DAIPRYLLLGESTTRRGNRDRYDAPANVFRARDGRWVYVGAASNVFFPRLLSAMGRPDLAEDPRFSSQAARVAHADEAEAVVSAWVATMSADEVVARLQEHGAPAA